MVKELNIKEIVKEYELKEEFDKFREELSDLKQKKEKQLLLDVSNLLKK